MKRLSNIIRILNPHRNILARSFASNMDSQQKMMKAIVQSEIGGPDTMVVGEVPIPVPQEGETLVKILYTGVNRADTLQRVGKYPPPVGGSKIIGLEFLGEECDNNGNTAPDAKKVMGIIPGGGYGQYATVNKQHLVRVPDGLDLEVAAAIPEVWMTAYQIMNLVGGGVSKNDYVLVHAAVSGVGTSILQLLRTYEAKAIAVASTDEKLEYAKSLGAVGGINYKKDPEFGDRVMSITDGHGADMILDCVGGSHWEQNEKSLARDGTWVNYGMMGGPAANISIGRVFAKRATIKFTSLRTRSVPYRADLAKKFEQDVIPLFEKGVIKPIIHTVLPLSKIAEAHKLLETNTTIGKIVIKNDL